MFQGANRRKHGSGMYRIKKKLPEKLKIFFFLNQLKQVPVEFEFIKKLDDTSYCKEWLTITPYTDFIEPGQKCDIKLEICVDKKSAWKFNSGEDKLYDILVLHLINGKDIFITVTGK